jgi:hypothetical protein
METVHEEFLGATMVFIDRANLDKKPFFAWFNSTRMRIWTRFKPESQGYRPRLFIRTAWWNTTSMLGIDLAGNGGTTPFRGEKNTNWESSCRVPAVVRWPGLVAPHTEINGIFSAEDWVQTCDFTAERQLIMRVRVAICAPA